LTEDRAAFATYTQKLIDYEAATKKGASNKQSKLLLQPVTEKVSAVVSQACVPPAVKWDRSKHTVSQAVDEAVILLIVRRFLPFSIVDEEDFRLVLNAASEGCYQHFCSDQLASTYIPRVAAALTEQVRRAFTSVH
jgi:hypothetical protein